MQSKSQPEGLTEMGTPQGAEYLAQQVQAERTRTQQTRGWPWVWWWWWGARPVEELTEGRRGAPHTEVLPRPGAIFAFLPLDVKGSSLLQMNQHSLSLL